MRVGACRLFTPAQDPPPHENFARSIARACDRHRARVDVNEPPLAHACAPSPHAARGVTSRRS